MTKLFHEEVKQATMDYTQDWQLFCNLMRGELEGAKLDKVEDNYLYVNKKVPLRFGLSSRGDFRKTNAAGRGYQPIIHHLKKAEISQKGQKIKINEIISYTHKKLTGGKENIELVYEPGSGSLSLEDALKKNREKDMRFKNTSH